MFEIVSEGATMPKRATVDSAGYELHCIEDIEIRQNEWSPGPVLISTGVTCKIPKGYHGQIWAKSSKALNGIMVLAGVIDGDYYPREIKVMLANIGPEGLSYKKGASIAQMIIVPYYSQPLVENVAEVRVGGLGSTSVSQDPLVIL